MRDPVLYGSMDYTPFHQCFNLFLCIDKSQSFSDINLPTRFAKIGGVAISDMREITEMGCHQVVTPSPAGTPLDF